MKAPYDIWEETADSYSKTFGGKVIAPTDLVEYPMAIMSLLSDAQEELGRAYALTFQDSRGNANINAAKVMLCRMKDAAREAERSGNT